MKALPLPKINGTADQKQQEQSEAHKGAVLASCRALLTRLQLVTAGWLHPGYTCWRKRGRSRWRLRRDRQSCFRGRGRERCQSGGPSWAARSRRGAKL